MGYWPATCGRDMTPAINQKRKPFDLTKGHPPRPAVRFNFYRPSFMHYFDPNVAAQHGITEAVIIQHFQFWIKTNKRKGINENEGRTWTYVTVKELSEWFDYLSEKQVRTAISNLVDAGVLMKGNFNRSQYDRTTWYAFTLEDFWIKPEGNFQMPKPANGKDWPGEPIPDNSTGIKTNKETTPAAGAPGGEKPRQDPPREKRPGKKNTTPDTDWQRWVDRWFEHFRELHDGTDPMFNPAQSGALKKLRVYLCKIAAQVPGKSRDDCGFAAWCYILDNWAKLREWLQGQFDLTVILKKINDILNSLKNATNQNRGTNTGGAGTSQQRVDAVRNY